MQARQLSSTLARVPTVIPTLSVAEGRGLAHDAGNLIGALGLYCDLLEVAGVLKARHAHYASEIRLLSQRSAVLITRLLQEFPAPCAAPQAFRPEGVVDAFGPLLRSLTGPDVELLLDVESGLPFLPFAPEVLERILVNLTRNAVSALRCRPSGGALGPRVRILLFGDAHRFGLRVSDNGPGMSARSLRGFLQPVPLAPGASTGLGHHVVHELLQSTGGELGITSSRSGGTEITILWKAPGTAP